MYTDTVTIFNLYSSTLGDIWYPTVVKNCQLIVDKAAAVAKTGLANADSASLHISFGPGVEISGKKYIPPKEWKAQTNDMLPNTITFTEGTDFFVEGEYDGEPVFDEDYINGFYDFMNKKHDACYLITTVAKFKLIPHFEIGGK